jgi:peptidylprolyl isomerase
MASGPGKNNAPPGDSDRAKMMRVLIPALAVGVIVILAAVIAGINDESSTRKMSDGSNGAVEDPGLTEMESGVKYRDIKEGSGDPCPQGAKVKVKYKGWLIDGTVFDSTKDKGDKPIEFELNEVVRGWQVGIPGMKPGGIRKLVVYPQKGYGNRSQGKIPANSTLIFEVELVSFTPGPGSTSSPGTGYTSGAGKAMSDGSDGGTDDPGLKDIGEGLRIRDLKEGSGDAVPRGASVTVHYTGWLTDGTEFDSSKKRGQPATFSLNQVVKGWGNGIPGMKPGGIRKLVIPSALGYGPGGSGKIPGNATLIFEVELIKVN